MARSLAGVAIVPMTPNDIDAVVALARTVWCAHYPGIITPAQIEYMLKQRYAPELLRDELERDDLWWDLLSADGTLCAFASCILDAQPGEMKLDKLYVHPNAQRRGFGGMLIGHAAARARRLGCERLLLAVNKRNRSAIDAYHKHGFRIAQAVVKDIGQGFAMDDYIMVLDL
jgi:diamine N-acetyltransferase